MSLELFQALTPPKNFNFLGSYQIFLKDKIVSQLQPNDLVVTLNWLEGQGLRDFGHPFEELGNAILLKAWDNFNLPGVAESFTKVALIQWRRYKKIITSNTELQKQFASSLLSETRKRHTLLEKAIFIISEKGEDLYISTSYLTDNILFSEDILWMLEKIQNPYYEKTHRMWAKLIRRCFNRQDARQIDAILVATQTNNIFQEIFAPFFTPIELHSEQAKKWQKWASIILAIFSENPIKDSYQELVKRAYFNAPDEFIKTVIKLIDRQSQENEYLFVINRLEQCWDERLQLAMLEKAKDPMLKAKCVGQLLEELLKQGLTEAKDIAKSLISLPLPSDNNEREKVLISAKILVENSDLDSL